MVFGQVWSTISSIGRRQSIPYIPLSPGSPRLPFLKNQRSQTRFAVAGAIALLVLLGFAARVISLAPAPYNRNLAFYHTPAWTHALLSPFYALSGFPSTGSSRTGGGDVLLRAHGAPEPVWPLLNGTWAGDWVVPELTLAQYAIRGDDGTLHESLASPALLMLHVFSEASPAGRRRRETLRKSSPLRTVPAHFRHLVDLRYVVFDSDPATWDETRSTSLPLDLGDDLYAQAAKLELTKEEDEAVRGEMAQHRDVVRLQAPVGGFEATWEWIRWAGSAANREGHWILKCSDDMLPVLPNIIPDLMTHDPTVPTYFGSSIARKASYDFYFDGGMYGFSWGLLQTLAEVTLDARIVHAGIPEDALVGELMYQLPSKPLCRDLVVRAELEDEEEDEYEDNDEEDAEASEGESEPTEVISNETPAIDSIASGETTERRRRIHARDFDPVSETFVPDHHRSSWPHRLKSMLPFTSKWDASSAASSSSSSSSAHHQAVGAGAAAPAYSEADDGVVLSEDAFPLLALASGECLLEPTAWDARPPRGGWRSGWPYPSGSGLLEDPRTGLVRLDWETSVGVRGGPGTDEDEGVLGWRIARPDGGSIRSEEEFDQAYKTAWHDLSEIFRSRGRPFQWQVPEPIEWLYEQDALNLEGI